MKDIRKIESDVYDILNNHPYTRNSDDALYLEYCMQVNPIICNMPFKDVMRSRKELGFPNIKSVERARRKLQAEYPKLRACKEVEDARYENYKIAKEYAI